MLMERQLRKSEAENPSRTIYRKRWMYRDKKSNFKLRRKLRRTKKKDQQLSPTKMGIQDPRSTSNTPCFKVFSSIAVTWKCLCLSKEPSMTKDNSSFCTMQDKATISILTTLLSLKLWCSLQDHLPMSICFSKLTRFSQICLNTWCSYFQLQYLTLNMTKKAICFLKNHLLKILKWKNFCLLISIQKTI